METITHGGDSYRNLIELDFSINVNPLGMPVSVKSLILDHIDDVEKYPDIRCQELKKNIACYHKVTENQIMVGNGASEILMAIMHGLKPSKVIIPVPSFSGYQYAFKNSELLFYEMNDELDVDRGIISFINSNNAEMIILTNPNNPTGRYIDKNLLKDIIYICKEKNIIVLMDECFMELSDDVNNTIINMIEDYTNVIILRAFTKSFAIPGIRLGYAICGNEKMTDIINQELPEWNISVFAQQMGKLMLTEKTYLEESVKYIRNERQYLEDNLIECGVKVIKSSANYLLIYVKNIDLYTRLLEKKILIRDCSDYQKLGKGYYRIAVKKHDDNVKLIDAVKNVI